MTEYRVFSGKVEEWETKGTYFAQTEIPSVIIGENFMKRISASGESPELAVRRLFTELVEKGVVQE